MSDEFGVSGFHHVGYLSGSLADVADSPNTTVGFITGRVTAGNLVMRNDFVIPISDVEAAIRAEFHVYGAEPVVFTDEEIFEVLGMDCAGVIAVDFDTVDGIGDGVGEEADVLPFVREATFVRFTKGEARESGAADSECVQLGHHGLVRAELFVADS